jgi:hypothetical protein
MSKLFSKFWGNGRLIVAVVALALIPTVNRAPASKNSSNSSKKKFTYKLPGAVRIQAPRASMKTLSIPIFPQHKFDFGDSVFIPSIQHGESKASCTRTIKAGSIVYPAPLRFGGQRQTYSPLVPLVAPSGTAHRFVSTVATTWIHSPKK